MNTYQPFIYIIGWTELNAWYLGAKYARGCHPVDLWTTYFTSSKIVREIRDSFGEPDYFEVFTMEDDLDVRTVESDTIKDFELHKSGRWLNRGTFRTWNGSTEERSVGQLKRYSRPEEREKTSRKAKALWEDPDFRTKASAANKVASNKPEEIERRRQQTERLARDPKYREALREGALRRLADPEERAKLKARNAEIQARPEHRAKLSATTQAMWDDPVRRAAMLEARAAKRLAKQTLLETGSVTNLNE